MVSIQENGQVQFKFYRPGASDVRLTGDFDNWTGSIRMHNAGRGWWIFDAQLPGGEYRFRYVADGKWFTDYAAYGIEMTDHGWNSVLIVPDIETAEQNVETEYSEVRVAA